MTSIANTFTHRQEHANEIKRLTHDYYKEIVTDMMKLIVNDVKESDVIYFPTGVDTHMEYALRDGLLKHSLTFYCKIKTKYKQDDTPEFGYIQL